MIPKPKSSEVQQANNSPLTIAQLDPQEPFNMDQQQGYKAEQLSNYLEEPLQYSNTSKKKVKSHPLYLELPKRLTTKKVLEKYEEIKQKSNRGKELKESAHYESTEEFIQSNQISISMQKD